MKAVVEGRGLGIERGNGIERGGVMALLGMLLISIANILGILIQVFIFLFIARAILSWVSPDPSNPIVQFLYSTTDPIIYRVRQRVPPLGMFDLSVLLIILALYFIDGFVVGSLKYYGTRLLAN